MAVVTMQYSFKIPEEEQFYYELKNADCFAGVLVDLADIIRDKIKYNEDLTDEELKAYGDVQKLLYDLISEYGITLDYCI